MVIILCVRWHLRYSLSYRDLREMMIERGLSLDHVTIWRWVQHYAPILNGRIQREMRHPNRSWRVDETYIRVTGVWTYLYRAVDSDGDTIDFMLSPKRALTAAKLFAPGVLQAGLGTSAGHQCGWAPSICPCNRQPEVLGELGLRCRSRPSPYLKDRQKKSWVDSGSGSLPSE